MMELFLSRGADLNLTNRYGEQALQLAAWRGQPDAVRWLLDRGAAVNRKGKQWSALHYAAFAGHQGIVDLLLAHGADINARAPNDATVLMMAAREGHEALARRLLEAGADPNLTNDRGDTALAWAMRYGNYRIAQLVSKPEEFAQAARRPLEPAPLRSTAAPPDIADLLHSLREAEAAGKPTAQLRQALADAVDSYKRKNPATPARARKAKANPALMITANRNGGERAELVSTPTPSQQANRNGDEDRAAELSRLLSQLRQAETAGRPTAELRKAIQRSLERMRTQ